MTYPKFLQPIPAAEYLQNEWGIPCSAKTLAKYRSIGGGPEFHKGHGAALYSPASLDAWAESRISGPMKRTVSAKAQAAQSADPVAA